MNGEVLEKEEGHTFSLKEGGGLGVGFMSRRRGGATALSLPKQGSVQESQSGW